MPYSRPASSTSIAATSGSAAHAAASGARRAREVGVLEQVVEQQARCPRRAAARPGRPRVGDVVDVELGGIDRERQLARLERRRVELMRESRVRQHREAGARGRRSAPARASTGGAGASKSASASSGAGGRWPAVADRDLDRSRTAGGMALRDERQQAALDRVVRGARRRRSRPRRRAAGTAAPARA